MTGGSVMKCSSAVLYKDDRGLQHVVIEGICNALKLWIMREVLIRAKKPL